MRVASMFVCPLRTRLNSRRLSNNWNACAPILGENWELPDQYIFRDDGYSGATLSRPGLDRLRDLAARAAFDRVLLTSDRLARKYVHQALLIEELEQKGCR